MGKSAESDAAFLVRTLIEWFGQYGRDLPWRHQPTPYQVWVSEIMLQQTQVSTVLDYYRRWMDRFPDMESLAMAPIEDVLNLWAGLGYYRRARYLHEGARYITQNLGGIFPKTVSELRKITGIGAYTAGAIASFAFHQDVPAIDGNVERVFSRFFGISGDLGRGESRRILETTAAEVASLGNAHIVNQAVMDIGASCCGRQAHCETCPLAARCYAHKHALTAVLPQKIISPNKYIECRRALRLEDPNGCVLLARRKPDALLGNLWEYPMITLFKGKGGAARNEADVKMRAPAQNLWKVWCRDHLAPPDFNNFSYTGKEITHIFTHIRMRVQIDTAILIKSAYFCTNQDEIYNAFEFVHPRDFVQYPMSSMMQKIML